MDTTHAALALLHCRGLGARGIQQLLDALGGLSALHGADARALRQAGAPAEAADSLASIDTDAFADDLRWAELDGNYLISLEHPLYPARLRELADPPVLLYVTGDPEVLHTPQVAMVGSRNPSAGGVENAERFAFDLAARGLCITSGLASGIDSAAHRGALAADGLSVAVTGTGLDRVYPASNRELAHRLAEQGALVSELPVGSPPRPANFPRRNRLISALSCGVLVVEATVRSGSLITARQASEQGREVLAIPGSIHNPMARGCHALIRQGAKLVETAEDVLEELAGSLDSRQLLAATAATPSAQPPTTDSSAAVTDADAAASDPQYQQLLEALGYDPVSLDTLVVRTGLPVAELSSMLLMLELTDRVDKIGGGQFVRRQRDTS